MTGRKSPEGDVTTRPVSRGVEYGLLIALVVAGAIITWFRVPDGHHDRVWAEDSNIFLGEALDQGPWAVLLQGYAGYQHFVPRLVIALMMPALDLQYYAVTVFAICAVLTGLVAGAVFWLSRDLVPWIPARVTVALITVIIPLATQETVGNLADLHTYAMWLAPWLLLYRPRTWWSSAGWAVILWATVMTEIQAVFFVFLIFFRLRRRDRRSWPLVAAFVVASAAQLLTAVTGERQTSNGPLSIPSTVIGWMINTVMPLITADPVLIRAWVLESGVLVAVAILVPIVVAAVVALVWGSGEQRLLVVSLLLGSAAIYTGSAWANSDVWFMYAEEGLDTIGALVVNIRYGVASGMMLVAVIPIAAAVVLRRWGGALWSKVAAWAACVVVVAALGYGSTMTISLRDWVGAWSPAVAQAVEECSTSAPSDVVTLPVAPDRSVDLVCEDVLAHTGR
ncbi:hypothetical protein [Microbacterium sp. zg-YB36]|uniref:hypothetical protein n=1 Tax=Microbacterium sp. zg-YB36 TaxID=2969407 RepID=UPI00214C3EE8|nr:hypothetical protein [Microbacterium sp. zg-YB36]MDL5352579.1 hypothetical protein [Microbacterium sp. zg-YB36]